jgi:type VI secretion system secreted protein VgrG
MKPSVGPITMSGQDWAVAAHCSSMRISEQLSAPFLYEVEIISETAALAAVTALGDVISIALEVGSKKRYFSGIVTSLQSVGRQATNYVYRLRLRPWLWLLSRHTDCRIFQDAKVLDIVKTVFRDRGFPDVEERLSRTDYAVRAYTVQYRETDLNFVQRLLEEEGIYYFFRHEQGKHMLVLCDSLSGQQKTPFHEEVPHLPPDRHRAALLDHLDVWETVQDVESGAVAMRDYDFEDPDGDLAVTKAAPQGHPYGNFELFDYPGNYLKRGLGQTYAAIRLEEAHATAQRCLAQGNARGLLVGSNFTLSQHPTPRTTANIWWSRRKRRCVATRSSPAAPRATTSGPASSPSRATASIALRASLRSPSSTARRPPRSSAARTRRSAPTNTGA